MNFICFPILHSSKQNQLFLHLDSQRHVFRLRSLLPPQVCTFLVKPNVELQFEANDTSQLNNEHRLFYFIFSVFSRYSMHPWPYGKNLEHSYPRLNKWIGLFHTLLPSAKDNVEIMNEIYSPFRSEYLE